ncbi:MAG: hypothetical protein IK147_01900 [Clostridia bacterium]|nr:hypothetical protein [Clostridia bacterium]
MDKFGIFNLINALSGALKSDPVKDAGVKESLSEQNPAELSAAAARAAAAPLQSFMLTTMRSHEEFVKRVKSAKKEPK